MQGKTCVWKTVSSNKYALLLKLCSINVLKLSNSSWKLSSRSKKRSVKRLLLRNVCVRAVNKCLLQRTQISPAATRLTWMTSNGKIVNVSSVYCLARWMLVCNLLNFSRRLEPGKWLNVRRKWNKSLNLACTWRMGNIRVTAKPCMTSKLIRSTISSNIIKESLKRTNTMRDSVSPRVVSLALKMITVSSVWLFNTNLIINNESTFYFKGYVGA